MVTATPLELQQLLAELGHAAQAYEGNGNPLEAETRAKIRGQARKVFLSMMSPDEMGLYHLLDFMEIVAIRTCMELGVFIAMPIDRSISAEELGTAVGMTPAFLVRILRILVAIGFIDQTEMEGGNFKHTKFSLQYRDPMTPSSGALFKACYYLFLQNHLRFHEYITTELTQPYPEPDNIFHNSINWHLGTSGQPWFIPVSQKPEVMKPFQAGMSSFDSEMPPAGSFYDFAQFADKENPDRIQIVDVGGGAGGVITKIIHATPELNAKKCVLQDIPRVLELAEPAKEIGVQIMPHDFHTDQPVEGAKAYYFRYVLHDYNDSQATNMLTKIAAVMAPDSVVLIAESLMPERVTETSLSVGVVDQVMLAIGGKERTAKEYEVVFEASGLMLTGVYNVPGRTGAILEAKLKK